QVMIVNVSRTGMCVQAGAMLPQGAQIELTFPAHELEGTLHISGAVVWAHASGRAGLKLVKIEPESEFERWLTSILPAAQDFLPAIVSARATRDMYRPPAA
ncbi:MAG TPA: PilZ domain-containing protein, partial [Terriglobales bacterium]|nr:PilZ domain-containing protein [Terriglobales bacterium]